MKRLTNPRSCSLLIGLAQVGGEDAELFAVFGDGAAGYFDAFCLEGFLDGGIGEGFLLVLAVDDFLNCLADAGVGDLFAFGGGVAGGEESAHFGDSVRGADVFSGHGAGDGGGVYADDFGDFVHGKRLEVPRAKLEEVLLVENNLVILFLVIIQLLATEQFLLFKF